MCAVPGLDMRSSNRARMGPLFRQMSISTCTRSAATDLRVFGAKAAPPTEIARLCRMIGDVPGTDLGILIAGLAPDEETAERTLRDLITNASEMASRAAEE